MKKIIYALCLVPAVLAASITIVENGKSDAEIVWSAANDDSGKVVIFPASSAQSAARLAEYIKKSTGVQLAVKEKSSAKKSFSLKSQHREKWIAKPLPSLFPEKIKFSLPQVLPVGWNMPVQNFLNGIWACAGSSPDRLEQRSRSIKP